MCKDSHYQTSQPSRKNALNYFHNEIIIAFLCSIWKEKSAAAVTAKHEICRTPRIWFCLRLDLCSLGVRYSWFSYFSYTCWVIFLSCSRTSCKQRDPSVCESPRTAVLQGKARGLLEEALVMQWQMGPFQVLLQHFPVSCLPFVWGSEQFAPWHSRTSRWALVPRPRAISWKCSLDVSGTEQITCACRPPVSSKS